MNYLIKLIADTIIGVLAGMYKTWSRDNTARKRGQLEAQNAAHEDALERKKRADEVMEEDLKTGDDLLDDIRSDFEQ